MIHILTLTWNGLDKLKALHPGLVKNVVALGQPVKWYIRDNGSKDGTVEWLESYKDNWLDMEPLLIDHNRANFAQGVNSLANLAKECHDIGPDDLFLFLNNDIVFSDSASLYDMTELIQGDFSMVGARLLYNDTTKLQHAGVIFGPKYGNMPYHYRHGEESDKHSEADRQFQAVTAACSLVRAEDFFEAGGMDEGFHWAFEDIDLCLKIGELGKKIAYCGSTEIFHEESATLKKNPVNKMFLTPNVKRFKDKWFGKYDLDHEKYLKNKSHMLIV